jgi:hypothetical protein
MELIPVQETNTWFLRCDWRVQSTHFPSICGFAVYMHAHQCVLSLGIILHFPALCAERTSLAGTHLRWVALPPTMISNGLDAKKMCGKMNPLFRLGIAPNLCARPNGERAMWPAEISNLCARGRKKCFGNALIVVAHAPDVYRFVSELTFVRSLVCAALSISAFQRPILHTHVGPLFGLSHTRAANLIDNETWAFYRCGTFLLAPPSVYWCGNCFLACYPASGL